jgi:hypothetical protein
VIEGKGWFGPVMRGTARALVLTGTTLALACGAIAEPLTPPQTSNGSPPKSVGRISIEAARVPLNPQDPAATTLGEFRYAGGLALTSPRTTLLHELSDIVITGQDRFAAVGDEGIFLEARFVLDGAGQLIGVTDASISRLLDQNGRPLVAPNADAEGLTLLPTGDRLVSFETHHRIWLYPRNGGRPQDVSSPGVPLESNAGMEALTAQPDVADDAYLVGIEESGETWSCRVRSPCVKGLTVDKPAEFGLVAMHHLPDGMTAYLLRAYDPVRMNRITLKILRGTTLIARMDLAPPMTVDNFEGMTSVPGPDGRRRFYLISDDNNRATQRTLLLAFDWQPR